MKTVSKRVSKGMRFRYHYADSNPLWEVKLSKGSGVWMCAIVNEKFKLQDGTEIDSDWAGTRKVFTSKEILASVGMERMFEQSMSVQDSFYANLKVGQILHYNNGFENFVRCEVVYGEDKEGRQGNVLKPIAMIGKWSSHDLSRRQNDGHIYHSYFPKMMQLGDTFTPHYGNIVESPAYSARPGESNPATLTPIDLTVPEMTAIEVENARLVRLREAAIVKLKDFDNTKHRQVLTEVTRFIESGLDNGD